MRRWLRDMRDAIALYSDARDLEKRRRKGLPPVLLRAELYDLEVRYRELNERFTLPRR